MMPFDLLMIVVVIQVAAVVGLVIAAVEMVKTEVEWRRRRSRRAHIDAEINRTRDYIAQRTQPSERQEKE